MSPINLIHSIIRATTPTMILHTSLSNITKGTTAISRAIQLQNDTLTILMKVIEDITQIRTKQYILLTMVLNGHRNHHRTIDRLSIKCHINQVSIWESPSETSEKMPLKIFGWIETPTFQGPSPTINPHRDLQSLSKNNFRELYKKMIWAIHTMNHRLIRSWIWDSAKSEDMD